MSINDNQLDKAGEEYWSDTWSMNSLPPVWNVKSSQLKDYVESKTFSFMTECMKEIGENINGARIIEVGCARSAVLPLFAKEMGFQVAGLDYSLIGCEQAEQILLREEVDGNIYNCDIFDIPEELIGQFDVVVSFGLVEHFSDTSMIISALSRLLKDHGLMFTNIPNMNGAIGIAQKLLNRPVYDIHIPLTDFQLKTAHEKAGLKVTSCDYFLSTNFGVVNIESEQSKTWDWWLKKIVTAILSRCSMMIWMFERVFGELPATKKFSPYVNCVSVKQSVN